MTTCLSGKQPHATREAALTHQKALVYKNHLAGQSERSQGLNVYPCPTCAAWHVGHRGTTIPLVYHYTTMTKLDAIIKAGALRFRHPKRRSMAVNEPRPLLWFSWNTEWDYSVFKDPRLVPEFSCYVPPSEWHLLHPPIAGRAITELFGQGLIRWGASASVAKLRWVDYLARNTTSRWQRNAMMQRGHAVEWLATDQPVPLSECRAFEVWYRGEWVPGASVSDEDFEQYVAGRYDAYEAAWSRLREKVRRAPEVEPRPEDDAEAILLADYEAARREDEWMRVGQEMKNASGT